MTVIYKLVYTLYIDCAHKIDFDVERVIIIWIEEEKANTMYQIYNNPTKFPLSQGSEIRKYRNHHDKQMKTAIRKIQTNLDCRNPQHFPLRAPHARKAIARDIKRENKRLVNSLLRAQSDSSLRSLQNNRKESMQREKFFNQHRRRKWKNHQTQIQRENQQMYKRIKNIKPSITIDKHDIEKRKRYLRNRKNSRKNDIFTIQNSQSNKPKLPTLKQNNTKVNGTGSII